MRKLAIRQALFHSEPEEGTGLGAKTLLRKFERVISADELKQMKYSHCELCCCVYHVLPLLRQEVENKHVRNKTNSVGFFLQCIRF